MPINNFWSGAATYSHLGFTFVAAVLLFFFAGYWLDGKIGTQPLFAIIGAFIGAAGGFINLIKIMNQIQRDEEAKENKHDIDE